MQIEYGQLYTNPRGDSREVLMVIDGEIHYQEQSGENPQQGQCSAAEFEAWANEE